jgi:hypothetical protein
MQTGFTSTAEGKEKMGIRPGVLFTKLRSAELRVMIVLFSRWEPSTMQSALYFFLCPSWALEKAHPWIY